MPIIINDGVANESAIIDCQINVDDLKNYKNCYQYEFCCPEDVLQYKLDLAISIIEGITNTKICPYYECKTFKITEKSKIVFFTPNTSNKLIDIETVKIIYCDADPEDVENYTNLGYGIEAACDKCFNCGTLEVCGTWADYEVVPPYIKEAVYLLALEKIQPGITGLSASQGVVEEVEWDDFKIRYTAAQAGVIDSTGYYEIDRLISMAPVHSQIKLSIVDNTKSKKCCDSSCRTHF